MLLEFSIKNYRSIKDTAILSMVADGYDSKSDNVFTYDLPNSKQVRLLNTAMIFGSNGSGKSNITRALFEFLAMLKNPAHAGDDLRYYDPFKFNSDSREKPTEFHIKFLDKSKVPYLYKVAFTKKEVIKEDLFFWPNGRETVAFERDLKGVDDGVHNINIGESAQEGGRKVEKVYKNIFGISLFSSLSPNKVILSAFNALKNITIINTLNDNHRTGFKKDLDELLFNDEDFKRKINALMRFADLNITQIRAEEYSDKNASTEKKKFRKFAMHPFYSGDIKTETEIDNPLNEESQGSLTIFGLGSEIILTLRNGGLLFVDEFETSLHPMLSQSLIKIFQSKKLNPNKAQLIFTTHDTNLMDHSLFRRDQIWFTEKNIKGESSLFSMVDFTVLREDNVFEKWYLAGKFGALPKLDSIEKVFG